MAGLDDSVAVGDEGWLFLKKGTNVVASQYGLEADPGEAKSAAWANLLLERRGRLEHSGARYVHLGAPDKLTIYGDKLGFPERGLGPLGRLSQYLGRAGCEAPLLDPIPAFEAAKLGTKLYWQTDTHWTPWGCFLAYRLLCERLQIEPVVDLLDRPFQETEGVLDLGSRFRPPIRERVRRYRFAVNSRRVGANELVLYKEEKGLENAVGLHVGCEVHYRNDHPSAVPASVVLFGDSFAEYRPSLLTGMLAETFRELRFVWSAAMDMDYIGRVKPDIVISELAERFMPTIPGDQLKLEQFAKERIRSYEPEAAPGNPH